MLLLKNLLKKKRERTNNICSLMEKNGRRISFETPPPSGVAAFFYTFSLHVCDSNGANSTLYLAGDWPQRPYSWKSTYNGNFPISTCNTLLNGSQKTFVPRALLFSRENNRKNFGKFGRKMNDSIISIHILYFHRYIFNFDTKTYKFPEETKKPRGFLEIKFNCTTSCHPFHRN